jgi:hypothetical protein
VSYLSDLLKVKGLVSTWELGEATGGAADSADSNPGIYTVTYRDSKYGPTLMRGEPSLLPNGEGKSVKYPGTTEGTIETIICPPVNDVFSFEAWIVVSKLGAGHNAIMSRGKNGGYVRVDESGTITFLKSQVAAILTTAKKVTVGNVYHVVAVKNGATAAIYVNGEAWASTTTTAVVCEAGNVEQLGLGQDFFGFGPSEPFHGTLQYCAQYHVMLSAGEVLANFAAGSAAGYKAAILGRKGLVSLHECGETEGKALDAFRRGFPSILPGGEGHSCFFDDQGCYVEVAHAANLDVADQFTLQAWVKPCYPRPAAGKSAAIISRGQSGGYLRMNSEGKLELLKSQKAVILTSKTALALDQAYKITAVKNGKVAKIYIDDVLDAVTEETAVVCESLGNPLTIGADNFAGGLTKSESGNLLLQYPAIFNVAITPGLLTVKIMLGGKVEDKPRYVLVEGVLLNR